MRDFFLPDGHERSSGLAFVLSIMLRLARLRRCAAENPRAYMTNRYVLVLTAGLLPLCAAATDGRRFTYHQNLNKVSAMIDLIDKCDGKTECAIEVFPGAKVKIVSTSDSTVAFEQRNDYSASGVVSEYLENAHLPANPCIESPFPIAWIYAKPAFENRDKSPDGWNAEKSQFTGMTKSGFSFLDVPGAPTRVCIQPHGRSGKDGKPPAFAVLSLRLEATLGKVVDQIAFSDSMKRASQPFADRVEDDINILRLIMEDEEHLKKPELFRELRLLDSALVGLRTALNPTASGDYPSSADDGIRRAVHVALRAWSYVNRDVESAWAKEGPISRKLDAPGREVAYAPREFNSLLRWLITDLEAIRRVYGEPASRDYGQSDLSVPLSDLLLAQLDRLRGVTSNSFPFEGTPSLSVFDWLASVQETLVDLRLAAFNGGDDAPSITARLIPELATRWNDDASQRVLAGLVASRAKADMLLFLAFLDTLRRIPSARGMEFDRVLIGDISDYGSGHEARCSRDIDGEYCDVDLLKQCLGRTTCSTQLNFNGSWIVATTKTGTGKVDESLGGWVRGEEVPVVNTGDLIPVNLEICSTRDLITAVLYKPIRPDDRWTTESGGVLGGRTPHQPQRDTVYPPRGETLSSHCVRLDAPSDEGAYIIKSIRVKADLGADRAPLMNTVMINASTRLKQDAQEASRVARDYEPFLAPQALMIRAYRQALERLISDIDRSLLRFVNVPVTLPEVRGGAADVYVRANLLLSATKDHEREAQGFIRSLEEVIAQLALGFGLNREILSPAEILPVEKGPPKPKPEDLVKALKILLATIAEYQPVLDDRYQPAIKRFALDVRAVLRAVQATPRIRGGHDSFPYLVDTETRRTAGAAVESVGELLDQFRGYPRRYGQLIAKFEETQTWMANTFDVGMRRDRPAAEDSSARLAPLVEILHFAIGEAERQMALKWSDPRCEAAHRIQLLLRDQVLPALHRAGGGEKAKPGLLELGKLWTEPEFQLLLLDLGQSHGSAGPQLEAIVNQIEQTLDLNLRNLALILPARFDGSIYR